MGLGAPPTVAAAREADALLAIGTRFGEFSTATYTVPTPATQIVHIDIDPDVVGVNFPAKVGIVANARHALRALERWASRARSITGRAARREAAARDRQTYEEVSTPRSDHSRAPRLTRPE